MARSNLSQLAPTASSTGAAQEATRWAQQVALVDTLRPYLAAPGPSVSNSPERRPGI